MCTTCEWQAEFNLKLLKNIVPVQWHNGIFGNKWGYVSLHKLHKVEYPASKQIEGCPGRTCRRAHLTLTSDLDLKLMWTKVSNGISTHDGEQSCKFRLKSIQNSRSYSPDKNLTFEWDLDLTWTNFKMAHLHMMENKWVKFFLKSIHNCRTYSLDKRTEEDMHRHIHLTVIWTTISRSQRAQQKWTNRNENYLPAMPHQV